MIKLSNLFKKKDKQLKEYFSPKEINRRQLMRQNLIFLLSAIMVIIMLVGAVFYNLSFLINTINQSFKVEKDDTMKIVQFDLKGFEQLKNKLGIPTPTPILTPTPFMSPSPTPNSFPLTEISPTPTTDLTPMPSPSPIATPE